jgi:hypothetical protein
VKIRNIFPQALKASEPKALWAAAVLTGLGPFVLIRFLSDKIFFLSMESLAQLGFSSILVLFQFFRFGLAGEVAPEGQSNSARSPSRTTKWFNWPAVGWRRVADTVRHRCLPTVPADRQFSQPRSG